jgi:hypothetical protein
MAVPLRMIAPVGAVIGFTESGVPSNGKVEVEGVIEVWPLAGATANTAMMAIKQMVARDEKPRAANRCLKVDFKGASFRSRHIGGEIMCKCEGASSVNTVSTDVLHGCSKSPERTWVIFLPRELSVVFSGRVKGEYYESIFLNS